MTSIIPTTTKTLKELAQKYVTAQCATKFKRNMNFVFFICWIKNTVCCLKREENIRKFMLTFAVRETASLGQQMLNAHAFSLGHVIYPNKKIIFMIEVMYVKYSYKRKKCKEINF